MGTDNSLTTDQLSRLLRSLLEHGSELLTLVDATGRILSESPNVTAILGYAAGDLVGRNVLELAHPDDHGAATAALRELAASPSQSRRVEVRTRAGDGSWRWLETVGTNRLDDPEVQAIILNSRDITARKQAEQAHSVERQLLRTVVDSLPDAIYVKDHAHRFLMVNRALARHLGFTDPAGLIGKTDADFFPTAEAAAFAADEEAVLQGTPVVDKEETVTFPQGERRRGLTTKVPLTDAEGAIVGLIGIGRDITERRRAEEQLQQTAERSRLLIESIPMLAWQCNAQGAAEYCNHRWYQYTGEPPERTLGDLWQKALHPDDEARIAQETVRTAQTGDPYNVEYRLRRADGQYRWHIARSLPVRDATGKMIMWVGCAADIEEQKQAEATLRDSARMLNVMVQKRTAELAQVADSLRHEVNHRVSLEKQLLDISEREQRRIGQDLHDGLGQRLTAVRFLSANLGKRLAASRHKSASVAAEIHDELGQAVEDLRAVARGLHPVRSEEEGLMSALTELAGNTTQQTHIPCQFKCREAVMVEDLTVATHLYRIAQEAVGNAAKHAAARSIVIELGQAGRTVRLCVRDNGRGLLAPSRRANGLGLSIMKYRAGLIGAVLTIRRAKGRGTTVTCRWVRPARRLRGGSDGG